MSNPSNTTPSVHPSNTSNTSNDGGTSIKSASNSKDVLQLPTKRPVREAARRNPFIGGKATDIPDSASGEVRALAGHLPAQVVAGVRRGCKARSRSPPLAESSAKKSKMSIEKVDAPGSKSALHDPPSSPLPSKGYVLTPSPQELTHESSAMISIVSTDDGGDLRDAEDADGDTEADEEVVETDGSSFLAAALTEGEFEEILTKDYAKVDRKPRTIDQRASDIHATFTPHRKKVNGDVELTGWLCNACMVISKRQVFFKKGSITTLRTHIQRQGQRHYEYYLGECKKANAKPHDRAQPADFETEHQVSIKKFLLSISTPVRYSQENLLHHIIHLVIRDNQAYSLVDKESFRKLLIFLKPTLIDKDIPHRTKITEEIYTQYMLFKKDLKSCFVCAKGQIHLTFDAGTSRAMDPYFAITASFIEDTEAADGHPIKWRLVTGTIAFPKVDGSHNAETFAELLYDVITEYGIASKLGYTTSDNHPVNDKALRLLSDRVNEQRRLDLGADCETWDPVKQRVRCLEHSLHLSAQHVINAMYKKSTPRSNADIADDSNVVLEEVIEEKDVVEGGFEPGDILGKFLGLAALVRGSPQARVFWKAQCVKENLGDLNMKTWIRTWWGSLYDLLSYLLERRDAYDSFTALADRSPHVPKLKAPKRYSDYSLEDSEWAVMAHLTSVLKEPARAAQSFSSNGSKCLHRAVATLEMIQDRWEMLAENRVYGVLSHAIEAGLRNIRKWYRRMDDTDVYIMAMALNPIIKLAYIQVSWDPEFYEMAKAIVEKNFDKYAAAAPVPTTPLPTTSTSAADRLADNQHDNGYSMAYMLEHIRKHSVAHYDPTTSNPRQELTDYLKEPLRTSETDTIAWWARHSSQYPILASMARDYIAIPASSTDSERAFSAAGLIGTDRRASLNADNFEALQVLHSALATNMLTVEDMMSMCACHAFICDSTGKDATKS